VRRILISILISEQAFWYFFELLEIFNVFIWLFHLREVEVDGAIVFEIVDLLGYFLVEAGVVGIFPLGLLDVGSPYLQLDLLLFFSHLVDFGHGASLEHSG